MPAVSFPTESLPGTLAGEGTGRLINVFVEKDGDVLRFRRKPGLVQFAANAGTGLRGAILNGSGIYAAYSGAIVSIDSTGTVASVGTLSGTDPVTFAVNNRTGGPDMVVCRSTGGTFIVSTSGGGVTSYPDGDLPSDVNSVTFGGGYFVWTRPNGQIWASDLNSTAVNALSFGTAEVSKDAAVRVIQYAGTFWIFGTNTTEPWRNAGKQPFPLTPVFPGSSLPVGLLANACVAGMEEGFGQPPCFVANDKTVRQLQGYDTAKISTPAVERFIHASDASTLRASVYTDRGHAYWSLSSDQGTWEFDLSTKTWQERTSIGGTGWRGRVSLQGYDGDWIIGDALSTSLQRISGSTRTEGDHAVSAVMEGVLREYPARVQVPNIFLHFAESSSGSVTVQISHDGGKTWSTGVTRSLTQASKFPVRVNRLGLSTQHGIRVRLTFSADSDFTFMGAVIPKPEGRLLAAA